MRNFSKVEVAAATSAVGLALLAGGCSNEGDKPVPHDTLPPASTVMYPQIPGIIANTQNAQGRPVGVRTYAGPFTNEERRTRADATHVNVVCVESDGRDLVDTDVPPDQPEQRGNDWYLLTATTDRGRWEWVNTSYVEVTDAAGSAAVQECATIEGLDPRN